MAILVASQRFKGRLIDLVDQTQAEARAGNPEPHLHLEGPGAERFLWADSALDDERNRRFPILYIVRFRAGRAWAVGIKADEHFFLIDRNEAGEAYFAMVPKDLGRYDRRMVNWVARRPDRTYYNHGVSF